MWLLIKQYRERSGRKLLTVQPKTTNEKAGGSLFFTRTGSCMLGQSWCIRFGSCVQFFRPIAQFHIFVPVTEIWLLLIRSYWHIVLFEPRLFGFINLSSPITPYCRKKHLPGIQSFGIQLCTIKWTYSWNLTIMKHAISSSHFFGPNLRLQQNWSPSVTCYGCMNGYFLIGKSGRDTIMTVRPAQVSINPLRVAEPLTARKVQNK